MRLFRATAPFFRQPQDDVAVAFAGPAEPTQAIEGRPIEPDPNETVGARGWRGYPTPTATL